KPQDETEGCEDTRWQADHASALTPNVDRRIRPIASRVSWSNVSREGVTAPLASGRAAEQHITRRRTNVIGQAEALRRCRAAPADTSAIAVAQPSRTLGQRRHSCRNAAVLGVEDTRGQLAIQRQEPIARPRNAELPPQAIDDQTVLGIQRHHRERLTVRKAIYPVLLEFAPGHEIFAVRPNVRQARLPIEPANVVPNGYLESGSRHRLWIVHGDMKDIESEEVAHIGHPAPDRICRGVDLQAALALVDDCRTRCAFGLACAHHPPPYACPSNRQRIWAGSASMPASL